MGITGVLRAGQRRSRAKDQAVPGALHRGGTRSACTGSAGISPSQRLCRDFGWGTATARLASSACACCAGAGHRSCKRLTGVCAAVQAQQQAAQAQQVAAEKAAQLHDAARAKGAELYTQVLLDLCRLGVHLRAL